jgi:hypothetical protein
MKYYLLAYGRDLGTRDQVKSCLDSLPGVISWRSELPYTFFIQSELDAITLGKAIVECLQPKGKPRMIITELLSKQSWGWLTSWEFLGRKTE